MAFLHSPEWYAVGLAMDDILFQLEFTVRQLEKLAQKQRTPRSNQPFSRKCGVGLRIC
jgi:hypothetical protein